MIDILYIITNIVSDIADISDIPHLTTKDGLPINFSFWCRNGFSNFNSENRITAVFFN